MPTEQTLYRRPGKDLMTAWIEAELVAARDSRLVTKLRIDGEAWEVVSGNTAALTLMNLQHDYAIQNADGRSMTEELYETIIGAYLQGPKFRVTYAGDERVLSLTSVLSMIPADLFKEDPPDRFCPERELPNTLFDHDYFTAGAKYLTDQEILGSDDPLHKWAREVLGQLPAPGPYPNIIGLERLHWTLMRASPATMTEWATWQPCPSCVSRMKNSRGEPLIDCGTAPECHDAA